MKLLSSEGSGGDLLRSAQAAERDHVGQRLLHILAHAGATTTSDDEDADLEARGPA
jgi:hypothetical protein